MLLTRRHVLGAATALGLVTACSRPAGPGPAAGPAVRLEHRYGTTEVAGVPQRIVTVGLTEQDYPLAFGVTPVATTEWFGAMPGALWPWARERAAAAPLPEVLGVGTVNLERIAAARPDLVLAMNSGVDQGQYDRLSRIAPTIAPPRGVADYGARWDDMTRTVGRVLRREGEAERMVADLTARLDRARASLPAGRTGLLAGSLSGSLSGSLYIYPTGPAPTFLTSMGLRLPPRAAAALGDPATAPPLQLATERADVLDADVLLLGLYGTATAEAALGAPLVARQPVVTQGRVVALPESSVLNGALSFSSVLSLPQVIDGLVPRLSAALDGDPATPVTPVA